jgi:hypothetical protein
MVSHIPSCQALGRFLNQTGGDFGILADLNEVAIGITHVAAPFPAVIV